jgi:hypothetical protein
MTIIMTTVITTTKTKKRFELCPLFAVTDNASVTIEVPIL